MKKGGGHACEKKKVGRWSEEHVRKLLTSVLVLPTPGGPTRHMILPCVLLGVWGWWWWGRGVRAGGERGQGEGGGYRKPMNHFRE